MPLVISPRGMLEPWSLRQRALLKRLALWTWEGRNLAACSLLHATAEAEAHQFRALGLPQKTVVIPNAISVPAATLPARGDGGRKLLFLSRFHPKKGVDLLVQAWARVQAARPDWSLALHGPDQDGYMAQMQRLAESLGLGDDRIRFGGPLHGADKEALFRQADLFVLPTHSENFGNVVAEALSFGIPVITTTGAPWSGLQRHRCGWWIQPTRDALVAALEEALGLADQDRYRMGADGRAWMIREFSPEAVAGRMIAAYGGLLHPQEDKP
jgi:glycosyltransferase involved in cell wall biosynthesis